MATLQSDFIKFHDNIKIGTYDENSSLREKRDTLLDELTTKLKDEKVPGTEKKLTFKKFDQGSYAMNTGIKPKNDDYDIDVGIVFDISNDDYDSAKLKKLVYDKLNEHHNRSVSFNRPCITVNYSAGYHVDLVIYADNDDDYHIAWGKQSSNGDQKWDKAAPKSLNNWVKNVATETEHREQYRRCVRALKKWKEKVFSSDGNAAPPSIGLTIQAGRAFSFQSENDLEALIQIAKYIKNQFSGLEGCKTLTCDLPVEPRSNVYRKMTLKQTNTFYEKVNALLEALEEAQEEGSAHKASKILRKVFGTDFPLVEDSKATSRAPYVTTGNNA